MSQRNLTLRQFDMNELLNDSTILVLGKRRSGKSWLLRDIMYHKRNIRKAIVFSGTEEASPFFGDFIPSTFIYSEYKPDIVQDVILKQQRSIKRSKENGLSEDGKTYRNNMTLIMDDLLHDASNWKKEKSVKDLMFNGRHYNIMYILAIQYIYGIPPEFRNNLDYVFMFADSSPKNRRKLYDDFGSAVETFREFCDILDQCTKDYGCLVIKLSATGSNRLIDQLFWYRAEKHTNFRVGCDEMWKYHNQHYDSNYTENNANTYKKVLKVYVNKENKILGHDTR